MYNFLDIKPISGPGIDDAKHYLFLLDDYLPDDPVKA
jgi:hypothetical protein